MKILQNHFTTPEQSKRLLALGVPANSADMYYHLANHQYYVRDEFSIKQHDFFEFYKNIFYPCWSVGRLIEMLAICCKNPMFYILRTLVIESGMVDYCMRTFANSVKLEIIDFSKMEE